MERLVPLLLMIGVLVVAILSITPWPVGAYEDDAIYTVLAKSLATGEGYRMINLPGAPYATHYPPGYPFLLSLLWRVWPEFPDNVVVFKFANAVLLAVAAVAIYWFVRSRLGFRAVGAVLIAVVGTVSITMLQIAGLVLSEPLFVALLFLSLPVVERAVRDGDLRYAAVAGLLLGALTTVRTIGIVAIGAAILMLLVHRRLLAAVVLVAMTAFFLVPWQLWVSAHQADIAPILTGKYGSYSTWMVDGYREQPTAFARAVILKNLASLGTWMSYLVMPVTRRWVTAVSLLVLVPTFVGGLILLVKRVPVMVGYTLLYLGLIVVWPFDPYRFLLALWPVMVLVVAAAARGAWQWRPASGLPRLARGVALGAIGYLAVGHLAYNWRMYQGETWIWLQKKAGLSSKPLVEWVNRNTRPEDVLSTEHDVLVYLYTGRRGVPTSTLLASQRVTAFTPAEDVRWMGSMVHSFEPRYLITGWPAHITAADSLSAGASPVLRRAGSIPHHVIYERIVQ